LRRRAGREGDRAGQGAQRGSDAQFRDQEAIQFPEDRVSPQEAAPAFRAMADQIERNADSKFGGAYVIIPPGDYAMQPMSVLVLDTKEDPAGFFNLLDWRTKMVLTDID